ncbi:MAG: cadherin-like beta sandwich domain-containing protein [Treponema sp.]|jgi:parallel beta-helix repeat protein|nr:cadherin-like beta sandwich domain-containing protein [Treponema sp.]
MKIDRIKMTNKTLYCLIVITLAGCVNPLEPPVLGPEAGPNSLVIHIAGDSGGERTAIPVANISSYTISVSRNGAVLGSLSNVMGGPYLIALTDAPAVGDMVYVDGFNSGVKTAEGVVILRADHIGGSPVTVILQPLSGGSGRIDLHISFPGESEITVAEISLYPSLTDYQNGNIYLFKRYRKDSAYGAGAEFDGGTSLPLSVSLPSGNYVGKVEFYRGYVKVKTLIQTILVRDGLTTDKWDRGGGALTLGVGDFASSNADLAGISIGGDSVPDFDAGTHSYSILAPYTNPNSSLSITAHTEGQKIEVILNGTALPLSRSGTTFSATPILNAGGNSFSITVTAPDGATQQTYSVSYTYTSYNRVWYVSAMSGVSPPGNDTSGNGTAAAPFATVGKALDAIKIAYGSSWPGWESELVNRTPVPALIQISGSVGDTGNSNGKVEITDSTLYAALPPIMLAGDGGSNDKIDAGSSKRALYIKNADVILGNDLTITGGNADNGGGVRVEENGKFTMNGGTISGNSARDDGGGVAISKGSFIMNGGIITGNTTDDNGGGVAICDGGSFTMNGGTISGNESVSDGHGAAILGGNSSFTMNGGTISGNTTHNSGSGSGGGVHINGGAFTMHGGNIIENSANNGGGVYIYNGGRFAMDGASIISGNSADSSGGGVYVGNNDSFTMSGGTISENSSSGSGGGVHINGGSFDMYGGSVSANTGGGVCVDNGGSFDMYGGSVSANTDRGVYVYNGSFTLSGGSAISGNNGGGVYFTGSSFTMNGGSVSGNTAGSYETTGGGVYVYNGGFAMSGGSVSGNTAQYGGGVYIGGGGSFAMYGGSVSRNSASGDGNSNGGGVHINGGSFTMDSGSVSGNNAASIYDSKNSNGGGVYVTSGSFNMNGGSVSGNTAHNNGGGVYVDGSSSFTMSGAAAVDTGNKVGLNSGRVITLSGSLSANPAANIETAGGIGTPLLGGDIPSGVPQNYTRFLVNGLTGGIDSDGKYSGP